MSYTSAYTGAEIDAGIENAHASVLRSGSAMTGPLILHDAPTDERGAATKKYVDDAESAKAYADEKDAATLNEAKSYTDTNAETTLSESKSYTDQKVSEAKTQANAGTNSALKSAKKYTDESIPTVLPNPNALTFTGAASGTYDGSSSLEINIPTGSGSGSGGVSSWNDLTDKPFYAEHSETFILPETMMDMESSEGVISEPLGGSMVIGESYTVMWNGTEYTCIAKQTEALVGIMITCLGNLGVIDDNFERTEEPFIFIAIPEEYFITLGFCAGVIPLDDSSSITMSIFGPSSVYHTLDRQFLPKELNSNLINGTTAGSIRMQKAMAEFENEYSLGMCSSALGYEAIADGECAFAEGYCTEARGNYSHAEGYYSVARGDCSHAEGGDPSTSDSYTLASGDSSHAEGCRTTASGNCSHSEGKETISLGFASHAEGYASTTSASYAHAEGNSTQANGNSAHAEGNNTKAVSSAAHAEGYYTTADGSYSHSEGYYTTARGYAQHVQGKYNIIDETSQFAHIVGNGSAGANRSNCHTLDWQGNAWFSGRLFVGGGSQENGSRNVMANGDKELIIASSTTGSKKRFKISIDDSGTLSTVEISS